MIVLDSILQGCSTPAIFEVGVRSRIQEKRDDLRNLNPNSPIAHWTSLSSLNCIFIYTHIYIYMYIHIELIGGGFCNCANHFGIMAADGCRLQPSVGKMMLDVSKSCPQQPTTAHNGPQRSTMPSERFRIAKCRVPCLQFALWCCEMKGSAEIIVPTSKRKQRGVAWSLKRQYLTYCEMTLLYLARLPVNAKICQATVWINLHLNKFLQCLCCWAILSTVATWLQALGWMIKMIQNVAHPPG